MSATLTASLIKTIQHTRVSNAGFSQSEFYHPGGSVFGAVYTPDKWYGRKIGASVVSLPYLQENDIAIKARVEYDEAVLKKS